MSPLEALGWITVAFIGVLLLFGLVFGLVQVISEHRLKQRLLKRNSDLFALVAASQRLNSSDTFLLVNFLEIAENPSQAVDELIVDLQNYLSDK